jgi:hypothetical protein
MPSRTSSTLKELANDRYVTEITLTSLLASGGTKAIGHLIVNAEGVCEPCSTSNTPEIQGVHTTLYTLGCMYLLIHCQIDI